MMRIARLRNRIAEKEAQLKNEKELLQNTRTMMKSRVNGLMTANQALGAKTQGIHSRRQLLANGRCVFLKTLLVFSDYFLE